MPKSQVKKHLGDNFQVLKCFIFFTAGKNCQRITGEQALFCSSATNMTLVTLCCFTGYHFYYKFYTSVLWEVGVSSRWSDTILFPFFWWNLILLTQYPPPPTTNACAFFSSLRGVSVISYRVLFHNGSEMNTTVTTNEQNYFWLQ